jgi:hypothetical protein
VSDEAQVLRFRDEVLAAHAAGHVDLVFSNAGIGGGGSFIADPREQWEALIEDLRVHAPHVRVAVVLPGHVGTNIVANSMMAFGAPEAEALAAGQGFRDSAPLSAAGAASAILDGVRSGAWRILVGEDARRLDEFVRANPDDAYDHAKRAAATEDAGTGLRDAVAALLDTAGEQAAE